VCRRHLVTTDVLRGTVDGQERRAEGGGRSTVRKTVGVGPCIALDGATWHLDGCSLDLCRPPLIASVSAPNDVRWRISCSVGPRNCHPPNSRPFLWVWCGPQITILLRISNQQSDVRGPARLATLHHSRHTCHSSHRPSQPKPGPESQLYARRASTRCPSGAACVVCRVCNLGAFGPTSASCSLLAARLLQRNWRDGTGVPR
jgi:hypothetical protein